MIPLLQEGHDIRGFDVSPEMLEHCRKECRARGLKVSLSQQSFESFSYEMKFSAIIVPAGSFQLIANPLTARSVLRQFHDSLDVNGRLILDLDPLSCLHDPPPSIRQWQSGEDLLVLQENRTETDFIRQIAVSHLRYEHWRDSKLVTSELELFALRFWGVLEFELALHEAGFAAVTACGDYHYGSAPHAMARIITFEARA